MLKQSWSKVNVNDMAGLGVQLADPLDEFRGIRHGGRENHHFDSWGKENCALFLHDPILPVLHLVNLIKDNLSNLFQDLGTLVENPSENIHGHNEARGIRRNRHIGHHGHSFYQNLDQGSNFSPKINVLRILKTNESVALVITNPTQLILSQTDVGSERYRDLFESSNR
jgi:hypothetical protein